jgi:hypothetical protein
MAVSTYYENKVIFNQPGVVYKACFPLASLLKYNSFNFTFFLTYSSSLFYLFTSTHVDIYQY